jgi:hypothetical protein
MHILEDVGLLGKGVLIMSGHDDEFHPDSIPPSPALTMSTPGVIPSAPLTPNSIVGEGDIKSPISPPTSPPPSSPNNQLSPPRKVSATSNLAPSSPPPFVPVLALPPTLTTNSGAFHTPISHTTKVDAKPTSNSASWKRPSTPSRKTSRFGSTNSTIREGSVIHITNIQEASQVVEESKYHDTLAVLEDAINAKKLEPKENVAVLKRLVLEVEKMSLELENYLILIDNLEQNKVDKIDFQSLAKIVKELKAMENAMLSGKPILGFKCMSCNHDLERLSPVRGPQIPTNQMPRSFLSMLSAERIFSLNKRDISPM